MSVAEEAMDSSAAEEEVEDQQQEEVEEQQEEEEQEEEVQASPNRSPSNISAAGDIIEGKRAKKTVERLDFQAPKQKEKLKIGDGSGDKLGDIPRTGHHITKMKQADLKPLHAILFDRPGKMASLKKNLRLFNGFPFHAGSEQHLKKREKLLKNSNFTNAKLKAVCGVLDLEKKGTHSDLVDRILTFLIAPRSSGKRLPVKKKRKSKKKLSGDDSTSNAKKKKKSQPKPRSSSSSCSPKKSKTGSKSKAIVMETSSDEDEKEGADAGDKPSGEEQEESLRSKSAPLKRSRTPTKKTGPPKKKAKKAALDESDETPKKKKPAAKTKKADSSSSRRNPNATAVSAWFCRLPADDSDSDDEPLIRLTMKPPSEEKLKETVQRLLEEADLKEMTMKQICQKVSDMYPENDLSSKKDYIKQTVKSLIT
uniref:protein DEK isoform X1 n=1 Tax=Gasterosteus aculeatus aculeatus TaxID=481459 RepID=UPI001A991D2F|nr:protein DEK isoform X1 [Gasterosteus aculeatus aculeatus]XP_040021144.1 protein DEK isoform X1 [Gasterosteus aculeatus aculeatus]